MCSNINWYLRLKQLLHFILIGLLILFTAFALMCLGWSIGHSDPQTEWNKAVDYHASRWNWFIEYFGQIFFGFTPSMVGQGRMVVETALAYGMDYRLSVSALMFESTFGAGSQNYYGFICGNPGDFATQTNRFFAAVSSYGVGSEPWSVAMIYNPSGYPHYQRNFSEIFWACDGGR